MNDKQPQTSNSTTRREFIKTGSAAVAAASSLSGTAFAGSAQSTALQSSLFAGGTDVIRVGLVGCGGRGTGAAAQALAADPNARLVAMGDTFYDHLDKSYKNLKKNPVAEQVQVDADHKFVGFDAYQKVIDCVDVVLLTTPPHFRPMQLRAAIEAGKHAFAEKPVAVDAPGVRSILETCKLAKEKNLSIVSGLCWRYHQGMRETFKQIHDGAVGDVMAIQCSYNTRGSVDVQARTRNGATWNGRCETGFISPGCRVISIPNSMSTAWIRWPGQCTTRRRSPAVVLEAARHVPAKSTVTFTTTSRSSTNTPME